MSLLIQGNLNTSSCSLDNYVTSSPESVSPKIHTKLSTISFFKRGNIEVVEKNSSKELISQELNTLIALKDVPNISRVLEHSENKLYFERLEEFNLKLDLLEIRKYLKQLVTVLNDIHMRGYAHLDISPGNLMLDKNNHLVLIDFQLSVKDGEDIPPGCGTPGYIAPEIYTGCNSGFAADIYSAGVLFGQMLEIYIPNLSLQYLGSRLVTVQTTNYICKQANDYLTEADWEHIIRYAADLLAKMLVSEPEIRISPSEILKHPFILAADELFEGFDYKSHTQCVLRPRRSKSIHTVITTY